MLIVPLGKHKSLYEFCGFVNGSSLVLSFLIPVNLSEFDFLV